MSDEGDKLRTAIGSFTKVIGALRPEGPTAPLAVTPAEEEEAAIPTPPAQPSLSEEFEQGA